MEAKQCSKCKEIKNKTEFNKRIDSKDGYSYWCRECCKKQHIITYPNRKEKLRDYHKEYYIKNYDRLKDERILNKDKIKVRHRNYYINNKEYVGEKVKNYTKNNKEKIKVVSHNYYLNNIDKYKEDNIKWANDNPEKIKIARIKYYLTQKDTLNYKLSHNIRNVVWFSLKGNKQGSHWETIVGYTLQELMDHLESKFTNGMTWDNYGRKGWSIDHIIPRSLWQFETYADREFKQCWCLANLQPLWGIENRKKYNKCI